MTNIRPVRRSGSPGGEAHFSAMHKTGGDSIPTAIVVRKDGREIGRERVTDLRGALHHYGPASDRLARDHRPGALGGARRGRRAGRAAGRALRRHRALQAARGDRRRPSSRRASRSPSPTGAARDAPGLTHVGPALVRLTRRGSRCAIVAPAIGATGGAALAPAVGGRAAAAEPAGPAKTDATAPPPPRRRARHRRVDAPRRRGRCASPTRATCPSRSRRTRASSRST